MIIGPLIGLALFIIIEGSAMAAADLPWFLILGTFYTLLMWCALTASARLIAGRIPLVSIRAVAAHVAVQSVVMLLSFSLATFIASAVLHLGFTSDRATMIIIGLVAFSAALIGHGFYYLEAFHARTRIAEQSALRAQLGTLRAQINPHFLFNSLNSIAAMIRTAPARAEMVTESLADLFRYSLRSSEQPLVTLAEELESAEVYMSIERARFGERIEMIVDVPERLLRVPMPSLLLQPLVENAVKHGAGRMEGKCTITIRCFEARGMLHLLVTDTGPGFDDVAAGTIFSRGAGLANVRDRLRGELGTDAMMTIIRHGVEITVPRHAAPLEGQGNDWRVG
ncbi:MAG: histidine kinase family protein [Chlorobi bacterium]|nr:histidine kinase family protein [Chlorobiota bacterium]